MLLVEEVAVVDVSALGVAPELVSVLAELAGLAGKTLLTCDGVLTVSKREVFGEPSVALFNVEAGFGASTSEVTLLPLKGTAGRN